MTETVRDVAAVTDVEFWVVVRVTAWAALVVAVVLAGRADDTAAVRWLCSWMVAVASYAVVVRTARRSRS